MWAMAGGFFKRLFAGPISAALTKAVDGERVLFQSEPARSVRSFSGRVPGLRASGSKTWFLAAFAVTDRRVVGIGRRGTMVDVGYDMQADGPATLTLEPGGLRVDWDMDRVHPSCHGKMELHIPAEVPETTFIGFPVKQLTFNVDPQKVVRFTGSLRKLPAEQG
jgi:hypothetical protein